MAWAYSLTLSSQQLTALLQSLETHFGQAVMENVASLRFTGVARPPDQFSFNTDFHPQNWERGRAFGEQMELRWRRRGGVYTALLITEAPPTFPADKKAEIGNLPTPVPLEGDNVAEPLRVLLWGERQNPDDEPELPDATRHQWYEERIPRFLDYPWTGDENHLALEVARYRALSPPDYPGDFIYRFVRLVAMPIAPIITPPGEEPEEEVADFEEEEDD